MNPWDRLVGEPAARMIGPFPRAPFLETWRDHHPSGDLAIIGSAGAGAVAAIVVGDGRARLAGEEHLTDYHSPLGPDPAALVGPLLALGVPATLDSLPGEVVDPIEKAVADAGVAVRKTEGEPCMVLDLSPPGDDGWEAMLSSKQRHEVRRKRRRFIDFLGGAELEHDVTEFGTFVDLHRAADGDKGEFMTHEMVTFFEALLGIDGARLDVLRLGDRSVVAAAFGFEDDSAYYLYNSAFDPAAAEASPGIVLVDRLLQAESAAGRVRFDFLKGTETYKRRLGAVPRPLFTLEVDG